MSDSHFFVANNHAVIVANDFADLRYRASVLFLPYGAQEPARNSAQDETLFLVEQGSVEFMINGASTLAGAGSLVRVPAGIVHAYRNAGDRMARILVRMQRPTKTRRLFRVTLEYAA